MAIRGRNEGTIYQKPNGRWLAQVSIRGKRISHGAKTRAECYEWLRTTLEQVDQGTTLLWLQHNSERMPE